MAAESIITLGAMLILLLAMMIINGNLRSQSAALQQQLEAASAAAQVALAINAAAAGGNGSQVSFLNSVGGDVTSISIYAGRSLRVAYAAGGYVSQPLVTNRTVTNLAAYWSFDENSQSVSDMSGNGNSGTVSGAVWTANGKYGGAYSFNGVNAYINAPSTQPNPFTSMQGTFSAWVYLASGGGSSGIISHAWGASSDNAIWLDSGGKLYFQPVNVNPPLSCTSGGAVPLNSWAHMAVVSYESLSNLNTIFYINGAQACSFSEPVTGIEFFDSNTMARQIGLANGAYFNGYMDEVRIYNRALSPDEISAMYVGRAGAIPINRMVSARNSNGIIYIEGA